MHMRAPQEITDYLRNFAHKEVGPAAVPQLVTITPEAWCKPGDCFENVRRKVAKEGGRIQFGWALWATS
jgi:hypothetical protein